MVAGVSVQGQSACFSGPVVRQSIGVGHHGGASGRAQGSSLYGSWELKKERRSWSHNVPLEHIPATVTQLLPSGLGLVHWASAGPKLSLSVLILNVHHLHMSFGSAVVFIPPDPLGSPLWPDTFDVFLVLGPLP